MLVGRRRNDGERYPGGKLRPRSKLKPDVEPISGVLWQRLRAHGRALGIDQRLTSELGRLNLYGELTVAMTAAGLRIAEIYGRYEGLKGLRRSTKSPSYNASYGESGIAEELLGVDAMDILEDRIRKATEAYHKLVGREAFIDEKRVRYPEIPGMIPAKLRNVIEQLCVEDKPVSPAAYDDIREFLHQLAIVWKIQAAVQSPSPNMAAGRGGRHGPALHFNKHEDAANPDATGKPAEPKRPNLDRIFWIQVAKVLRPDLNEHELGEAFDIQQALKAREIFRRAKERKGGTNVVPFR